MVVLACLAIGSPCGEGGIFSSVWLSLVPRLSLHVTEKSEGGILSSVWLLLENSCLNGCLSLILVDTVNNRFNTFYWYFVNTINNLLIYIYT